MGVRAVVLERLRRLLRGRTPSTKPTEQQKMRRAGRDYQDKMRRVEQDK